MAPPGQALYLPSKKLMESKSRRLRLQLLCAMALVVVGAGLLVAGFAVSPRGEIHSSVLVSFGEILTFAGAVFGIDYRYKSS